jgi:sulfur relay (sulfurtransferase) complex TusBCD TusD component (DsrE family)
MIAMARTLFILNDAPYGTERSYNGLRLAGALSERKGFEGNLRPDVAIFR